tara:strand:- start:22226 stop:23878 length:1653 start_codon:yes stop_codon:yes gene_type:complete
MSLFAQEEFPKGEFVPPLDIPLVLAGNFGELRSNHFHSGIDIKTQQREGLPIYSVGEGSVTRIKVSLWGYGKVIYVTHPNGYTSVYGHLQKFSPELEAHIKKIQYEKQAYEVEIFPDYGELPVAKGGLIAYSGNTGGSAGPHLHFEIRKTVSERATNPLLYGFEVRDATNPTLLGLYGYSLSADAQINRSNDLVQINYTKQPDGSYLANTVYASGTIGFGVNAYDRQDLAANKNGVYSIEQLVNGEMYTKFDFEQFSFAETRYINTLIDYDYFGKYRKWITKCFRSPGNALTIYRELKNDGKIVVAEGMSYTVEILLKDLDGNLTKLVIPVEGKQQPLEIKKEEKRTSNYLIAKRPNNYDLGAAKVYFPANTFYEDFYIDLKNGTDTVTVHNNSVPAHRDFTLSFDASRFAPEDREKMFIARLDGRLRPNHTTTYRRDNTFTTRTRNLGVYTLAKDTVAPTIKAKNFKDKQWLTNYRYLSLTIRDDLSGVDSYSATLNGEWILMEYETKTNTITYNFEDKDFEGTQYDLKVTVMDNVGNSSTFTSTFYRK